MQRGRLGSVVSESIRYEHSLGSQEPLPTTGRRRLAVGWPRRRVRGQQERMRSLSQSVSQQRVL